MKIEDVPQHMKYMKGTLARDLAYAIDENGNYKAVVSSGWDVKNDALDIALDEINEECEEIKQRVLSGETSTLEYHAAANFMGIDLLSSYTGISKRMIRKHFDPKEFARLDQATYENYADTLRITVEELKSLPE